MTDITSNQPKEVFNPNKKDQPLKQNTPSMPIKDEKEGASQKQPQKLY